MIRLECDARPRPRQQSGEVLSVATVAWIPHRPEIRHGEPEFGKSARIRPVAAELWTFSWPIPR
jgi:hypothetical protein